MAHVARGAQQRGSAHSSLGICRNVSEKGGLMAINFANVHVVPHADGWAVTREDGSRVSFVFKTQDEAIDTARNLAQRSGVELIVHGEDGEIRLRDSYGNDLFPPKG
jgi:Uncharacterized protein conserved in bacteria (DUF2188)